MKTSSLGVHELSLNIEISEDLCFTACANGEKVKRNEFGKIIENIIPDLEEKEQKMLLFLNGRIQLWLLSSRRRRYSSNILTMNSIWQTNSPTLYRQFLEEDLLSIRINLEHLQKRHQQGMGKRLKFAHKFSTKVLNLKPTECCNVMLSLRFFHDSTVAASEHFANTGASVSFLPIRIMTSFSLNPSLEKLASANGTKFNVVVAEVECPRSQNRYLYNGYLTLREDIHSVKINLEDNHEYIKEILIQFPIIISHEQAHDAALIHIDTGDSPRHDFKARRLSPEKMKICRSMLDSLLQSGVLSATKNHLGLLFFTLFLGKIRRMANEKKMEYLKTYTKIELAIGLGFCLEFWVDTSASMEQKAYVSGRCSLLDVAKGAVEFFVKMRQKSCESRGDRYMLLTFEDYPRNIKAGWKENLQTFMSELKNLVASGMTTMGSALKQVFDILNMNRMQTGIDMYGQGRYPFYLEPAVIIVISDGGKLTTQGTVQAELNLPMYSTVPGSELTREPFRWDQRLYALVLRMAGTPPASQDGHVATDNSPIDAMCEVTGGRSYMVTSQRVLHQCIDSLVQKLQFGVVVHFEKIGQDPPILNEHLEEDDLIFRQDVVQMDDEDALNTKGLTFSKENNSNSRPHTPNPILSPSNIRIYSWFLAASRVISSRYSQEPMIIDNLPFDKYELEPSPLTLYILARKQPKISWQVFIQGSGKGGPQDKGHPFDELFRQHRLKPTNEWKSQFNNYLKTMPSYYAGPLRKALTRMGAGNLAISLIPDSLDNCLSYTVSTYLKRLKNQAKLEYDKTLSSTPVQRNRIENLKIVPRSPLKKELLLSSFPQDKVVHSRDQFTDFSGYALQCKDSKTCHYNRYRNPFDVPRHDLLDQILVDDDSKHSLPIGQMGNYQDYLKRMPTPLKEIENTPVRQHMFGNPFKINKNIMLDEVVDEIALAGGPSVNSGGIHQATNSVLQSRKRLIDFSNSPIPKKLKKGPLPRDFIYRSRSYSLSLSTNHNVDYSNLYIENQSFLINDASVESVCSTNSTNNSLVIQSNHVSNTTPEMIVELPEVSDPPQLSIPENTLMPSVVLINENELSCNTIEGSKVRYEIKEENCDKSVSILFESPITNFPEKFNTSYDGCEDQYSRYLSVTTLDPFSDVSGDCHTLFKLNNEELRSIKLRNQNIRQIICKEVKRPGKNHDRLYKMLKEDLHGPSQIRRDYIKEVIQEAFRFKRKSLAEYLLLKMDELVRI
ncbi:INTS6 [Lepeophtheirus salmonis]|uniref:INTS6 n=1 Tax=Lepeophtheirus salmonis TaxID=72036 RepID=A0A7R8CH24_LEPSM|nr:INTS6 [Lepeophtheirus salmonis]CAF2820544.1 INTS6 [Lepeophtheirus salmonis]